MFVSHHSNDNKRFQFAAFFIFNCIKCRARRLAQKVAEGLSNNPSYVGARSDGVSLAWDYEALPTSKWAVKVRLTGHRHSKKKFFKIVPTLSTSQKQ